jgi:Fibronectin type III domain
MQILKSSNPQILKSSKNSVKTFVRLSSACLVSLILCEASFATNCVGYKSGDSAVCACLDGGGVEQSRVQRNNATGAQMNAPYNVQQCTDSSCSAFYSSVQNSSTTGVTEYYKNTSGTGYYKCTWTVNVGFGATSVHGFAPTAPTGLSATAVSATQINLSWTDNSSDETGFKISKDGTFLPTTAAGATSYNATGLTCNTAYTFTVVATNATGDSSAAATTPATTTTSACSTPINASINLNMNKPVETFATEIEIK